MYQLKGGATRSEQAPRYDLVPSTGLRRIAQRFALGAEKHGEGNWKLSVQTEEEAYSFCREAYNHMIEHANKMISGVDIECDDHLGAIGWAVMVFAYCEDRYGKPWMKFNRGLDKDTIGL